MAMKLHDTIMPYGILNSNYKKHLSVFRNINSTVHCLFTDEESFHAKFLPKIFLDHSKTVQGNTVLSFISYV